MGRGQYAMGRGVDIPWVGWVNIPLVGGSIYHGQGSRYTMGRRSKRHRKGVDMPWVGRSIYNG